MVSTMTQTSTSLSSRSSPSPSSALSSSSDPSLSSSPLPPYVSFEGSFRVGPLLISTEKFSAIHPGGPKFIRMHDGQDSTSTYYTYHKHLSYWKKKTFPPKLLQCVISNYSRGMELPSEVKKTQEREGVSTHILQSPVCSSFDYDYSSLHEIQSLVYHDSGLNSRGQLDRVPLFFWFKFFILVGLLAYLEYHQNVYGRGFFICTLYAIVLGLVGMNVHHDVSHGSVWSSHPTASLLLASVVDYFSFSSILWQMSHNFGHHNEPNRHGRQNGDPDRDKSPILRLHPNDPWKPWILFQWIIIPLSIGVFWLKASIGYTVDLIRMKHQKRGIPRSVRHYIWISLLVKCFTLPRLYILPFFYTDDPLSTALWMLYSFHLAGTYLGMNFLVSHHYEGVVNVGNREESYSQNWAKRAIETSSNWGYEVWNAINGGLNYQIEHHLFPRMPSAHYPTIAPVVRRWCETQSPKVKYVHFDTFGENFVSMMKYLYQMGSVKELHVE